jgi:predicted nucleic acid-binding protein
LPFTEVVKVGAKRKVLPVCRDPEDQKFIHLAAYGSAEVLVSGDRAVLELSGQAPFAIESPAQFKKRFS